MSKNAMNIFTIRTSAWSEEDFILATQLSEKQVRSIIQPMVDEEREGDFTFSNSDYVQVLKDAYPKSVVLAIEDSTIIEF